MPYLVKNTTQEDFTFKYKGKDITLAPGQEILTDFKFPSNEIVRGRREFKVTWSFVGLFTANASDDLGVIKSADGVAVAEEPKEEVVEEPVKEEVTTEEPKEEVTTEEPKEEAPKCEKEECCGETPCVKNEEGGDLPVAEATIEVAPVVEEKPAVVEKKPAAKKSSAKKK